MAMGWPGALVAVLLTTVAVAATAGPARAADADDVAVATNREAGSHGRYRAALRLATRRAATRAVVDATLDTHSGAAALRLLGPAAALPRVYERLAEDAGGEGGGDAALCAIVALGGPLPEHAELLGRLLVAHGDDARLRYVLTVLITLTDRDAHARDRALADLAPRYPAFAADLPALDRLWAGLPATVRHGLPLARRRAAEQLVFLGAPDGRTHGLGDVLSGLALAAQLGEIGRDELDLVDQVKAAAGARGYPSYVLQCDAIRWLAEPASRARLLTMAADADPDRPNPARSLPHATKELGGRVLHPRHLPALLAVMVDARAGDEARAGAQRIAAYLAPHDPALRDTLIRLFADPSAHVRQWAADAAFLCADHPAVRAAIAARAKVEPDEDVRDLLEMLMGTE